MSSTMMAFFTRFLPDRGSHAPGGGLRDDRPGPLSGLSARPEERRPWAEAAVAR